MVSGDKSSFLCTTKVSLFGLTSTWIVAKVLGTTGRLKSQPKNNYVDDHLLSTYEKFRFGFGFCLHAIDIALAIVAPANLSWMWDDGREASPY